MIFSNITVAAKERNLEFGTIYQICVGEDGRGRREIRLACPENTVLHEGCNFDYTIGLTKNGRPRINKQKDGKTYFLISTEGRYTRRGNGWVGGWINNTGKYKCLAAGNGADGTAGRIGYWDCLLLVLENERPENDWIHSGFLFLQEVFIYLKTPQMHKHLLMRWILNFLLLMNMILKKHLMI